jgi:hypothetical protein
MRRAAILFAAATVVMTWPLARQFSGVFVPHQDVYFNMWRLHWFAHAMTTSSVRLFDANIFYPERGTLALSDAMLVQGGVALPLILARVPPVLVHNLLMLLPIALSGLAMFALARYLTGSRGGALIAGFVFAYAPYRFEHIMHMELQWVFWTPLAFLAMHRTLDTGRLKYGLAMGAALALQMLSCIYYGVFLATLLVPAALLLSIRDRAVAWKRVALPLAAGLAVAVTVSAAYAVPFVEQRARVGDRPIEEVDRFSAKPSSYLSVPVENVLYGDEGRPGRGERRLFPGSLVVLLAITGLLLRVPSRRQLVYLIIVVAAFDVSLGFGGYLVPALHRFVPVYHGLRAMGRMGIMVVMGLAVLAAYGFAALMSSRGTKTRWMACGVCVAVLFAEYRTRLTFVEFPNRPPTVYRLLRSQPRGVVAELPVASGGSLPGLEPRHAFMSIFHWFPLVNGYSGNYPPSYLARIERLLEFPDERSLRQLHGDGVRYVIVHAMGYKPEQLVRIHETLLSGRAVELAELDDGDGPAHIFLLR